MTKKNNQTNTMMINYLTVEKITQNFETAQRIFNLFFISYSLFERASTSVLSMRRFLFLQFLLFFNSRPDCMSLLGCFVRCNYAILIAHIINHFFLLACPVRMYVCCDWYRQRIRKKTRFFPIMVLCVKLNFEHVRLLSIRLKNASAIGN